MQQIRRTRRILHSTLFGLWQSSNTTTGQILITGLLLAVFLLALRHHTDRSHQIRQTQHIQQIQHDPSAYTLTSKSPIVTTDSHR
jgi:hypothetical protein